MLKHRPPAHRQSPKHLGSKRRSPYDIHADPHTRQLSLNAVVSGIKSIVDARNSGALSEEMAGDLIKVLITTYTSELISQRVGGYLEGSLTYLLEEQVERWESIGERS